MSKKEVSGSIEKTIRKRIYEMGKGVVFSPGRFLDLGSRAAVDVALHRLLQAGTIRRIARGMYDYPVNHPVLGQLSPSVDAIAKALAGKDRLRLMPAGAYAANLLRLSGQVPAKAVFLTDGPAKKVRVGNQTIELKQTTLRIMDVSNPTSGLVIAALKYLGKAHVTRERIAHVRQLFSEADRRKLLKDLPMAPAWMHPFLRYIASEENET